MNRKQCFFALLAVLFLPWGCSREIPKSLSVIPGAINGAVVERGGEKLVFYGDPNGEITNAEMVLFPHFRRDVIGPGVALIRKGVPAVGPQKEKAFFIRNDSIWKSFVKSRYRDYQNQTTKIGTTPVDIHRFVAGGDVLHWKDLEIKVLNTPGYTRGAVSYLLNLDGKKMAFTGDLIRNDGKVPDLYSFQDSLGNIMGYHGYATRLGQLIASLQRIAIEQPDFIIPARGPVINAPGSAIKNLTQRIRAFYRNYLSITAYHWYYPEGVEKMKAHVIGSGRPIDRMPDAPVIQKDPPSWCMNFNTAWLVFSGDSSAFLMDCGNTKILEKLKQLQQTGRLKSLDGVFVTHYHDDHTTYINEVARQFDCPVYAIREMEDILKNPAAYRMPALTEKPVKKLIVKENKEKMLWKEFELTFFFFPGQTLYHGALLFEKTGGKPLFFIGDSFTPSGIDDYCLLNRNFLDPGSGYLYCLDLLKKLPEDVLLANQHVGALFSFSREQLNEMSGVLHQRIGLLKDMLPWKQVNFGIDEQWVRFYPYGQKAAPGATVDIAVKIMNHSDARETFFVEPHAPEGFTVTPHHASIEIPPKQTGEKKFKIKVPDNISPGVSVLTLDVRFNDWIFNEWSEGLLEVSRIAL